jgi:hypothetical protein
MCEHTTTTSTPESAPMSPAREESHETSETVPQSKSTRFSSTFASTRLLDSIRTRRKAMPDESTSGNQHAGSLKYEHVHRIEITITLLTGIVSRGRKRE